MLEDFLNHKLLINIKGATVEELRKLDELIGVCYISGNKIYTRPSKDDMYLHCRTSIANTKFISFSLGSIDVFDDNKHIPYIMYYELLNDIKISPNEIESLFV